MKKISSIKKNLCINEKKKERLSKLAKNLKSNLKKKKKTKKNL